MAVAASGAALEAWRAAAAARCDVGVIYFFAGFHQACRPGGQMDQVTALLQQRHAGSVEFVKVDAEAAAEAAEALGVQMVPSFVVLRRGTKVDLVEGAVPAQLQAALERQLAAPKQQLSTPKQPEGAAAAAAADAAAAAAAAVDESAEARLQRLVAASHTVLFLKGSPAAPADEASRATAALLGQLGLRFAAYDVAQDASLAGALRYGDVPLLYAGGKRIGDAQTVAELAAKEEGGRALKAALSEAGARPAAPAAAPPAAPASEAQLVKLINRAPVVLFMKGSPQEPRCGFSRQIVQLLEEEGVVFDSFDILGDSAVREGLKKLSNWPTYPQLYAGGKLVGGLDVVKELRDEGELKDALAVQPPPVVDDAFLKALTARSPVMLFMKGSPQEPRCGFSRQIVQLLEEEGVVFDSFDILANDEVREKLKTFSNWPTYPQLYSAGKLVGGLDVIKELRDEGELADALQPAPSSL